KPVIEQARVVTDVANADAGDVHEFVFSEPMNSSIAATGSTYRVQDGDATPTIVDIACGSGGTACSLSSDGRTLTVTLGSVSTVQTGTAGLDYPATVTNVSTGWKDQGGTALDLAGSPDKVLDTDTTAPTITDVRATVDGGLTGDSGTGDTHR